MHIILFTSATLLLKILSTLQCRNVMSLCIMQRRHQSHSVTLVLPRVCSHWLGMYSCEGDCFSQGFRDVSLKPRRRRAIKPHLDWAIIYQEGCKLGLVTAFFSEKETLAVGVCGKAATKKGGQDTLPPFLPVRCLIFQESWAEVPFFPWRLSISPSQPWAIVSPHSSLYSPSVCSIQVAALVFLSCDYYLEMDFNLHSDQEMKISLVSPKMT